MKALIYSFCSIYFDVSECILSDSDTVKHIDERIPALYS